ncbi:hypothetical protein GIX45_26945 [Erwinia sp. CPCC 100877]|nr:hypothetical protein [Erwinia sp. CPCC 100877]
MMEYEKDWFMRQIKAAVFNPFKKPEEVQLMPLVFITDEKTGEEYSVPIQNYLLELVLVLRINEAENLLYSKSEEMTNQLFNELGTWFYDCLEKLSEEELAQGLFTKAEIIQGRADLKRLTIEPEK